MIFYQKNYFHTILCVYNFSHVLLQSTQSPIVKWQNRRKNPIRDTNGPDRQMLRLLKISSELSRVWEEENGARNRLDETGGDDSLRRHDFVICGYSLCSQFDLTASTSFLSQGIHDPTVRMRHYFFDSVYYFVRPYPSGKILSSLHYFLIAHF